MSSPALALTSLALALVSAVAVAQPAPAGITATPPGAAIAPPAATPAPGSAPGTATAPAPAVDAAVKARPARTEVRADSKPAAVTLRTEDRLAAERALFPRPVPLKGNVEFWRKVFGHYSEHQSVFHDLRKPERVYDVLDFRNDAATLPPAQLASLKANAERSARARIEAALRRAAEQADAPDLLDDEARRFLSQFAGDRSALADAADSVRMQRGLHERTEQALKISGQYLPQMEQDFADEGLPRLLTRLPFVESSFNVQAYSKAAAAGLWQFIPSSARIYMRLNQVADDRRDPWTSTKAAAGHLKDDYRVLQDWPLAVTAYNYGRGGLKRALNEVGGDSLEDLLARYNSKRFGFASRNYYAEFLAATDVERDYRDHFGEVQRHEPVGFDTVQIERYTPYSTLARISGADAETFRRLNPSYRDEVVSGKLYVPAGDYIRVPVGEGRAFRAAYARLDGDETFSRQRASFVIHQVGKGETLARIASRYGISEKTIARMNGLKKGRVRAGMRLKLPGDLENLPDAVEVASRKVPAAERAQASASSGKTVKSGRGKQVELAAAEAPARAAGKTPSARGKAVAVSRHHLVKSGQSLSGIAVRYGTTVAELKRINGLRDAGALRAGMKLRLPS